MNTRLVVAPAEQLSTGGSCPIDAVSEPEMPRLSGRIREDGRRRPDARAGAGRGPDGERAAQRLDALAAGGQADPAFCQGALRALGAEAGAVVDDLDDDLAAVAAHLDRDRGGRGVPGGVLQQLPRDREQQLVTRADGCRIDADTGLEAAAAPVLLRDRAQGRL